jgi:hypothetical protein
MTTTPTLWRDVFRTNDDDLTGTQKGAQGIGLANGNILYVWQDDTFPTTGPLGIDIRGRIADATGELIGNPLDLNQSTTAGHQIAPQIVALPDGGFVVAYMTETNGLQLGDGSIMIERYDAAGIRRFNYEITGVRVDAVSDGTARGSMALTLGPDGDYIVAFQRIFRIMTAAQAHSSISTQSGSTLSQMRAQSNRYRPRRTITGRATTTISRP